MLSAKPMDKNFQQDNRQQSSRSPVTPKSQRESQVVVSQRNPPPPEPKPIAQRTTTDSLSLIVFILVQLMSLVIVVGAFMKGNPQHLAKPYDPDHRACGVDAAVQQYPFIFFATPEEKFLYRTVCVSKCPNSTTQVLQCSPNSVVKSCQVNPSVADLKEAVLVYDTVEYHSVCLPTTQYYYKELEPYIYPGNFQQAGEDINSSKGWIIFWIGVSFIISLIFLWSSEHIPRVVVWTFVIMFTIISIIGGVVSFKYYQFLNNPPPLPKGDTDQINEQDLKHSTQAQDSHVTLFLILSIILFSAGVASLISALFFRKRIQLTIMMVEVAADFVKTNKLIIFMPIILFLIIIVYFIVWLEAALYLYSTCPVSDQPNQMPYSQVQESTMVKSLVAVHLFAMLWFSAFVIGCAEFIITGAVADWYYKQGSDRNQKDVNPVKDTYNRLISYHVGSVALASGLIALVSFIRFLLENLYKSAKSTKNQDGIVHYIARCCCCCLWFYETFINILSKYAYVVINLSGQSFFPSAKEVVRIVEKDLETFVLVGGLGEIFTMVGRLFISSLSASGCFYIALQQGLLMPYVPTLICFIMSFSISSTFMCVYGIAAEAIYLVYIHSNQFIGDEEISQSTHSFQQFLKQAQQI